MSDEEIQEEDEKLQKCLDLAAEAISSFIFRQKTENTGILPPKLIHDQIHKDVRKGLGVIFDKIKNGMHHLLHFLIELSKEDPHILSDQTKSDLCQMAAIASVMSDHPQEYCYILENNKTLQGIFGLTDETLQNLYKAAKYIYEHQHYLEAASSFAVLTLVNPNHHDFWEGLGNSEYFCNNYEAALMSYAMAIQVNPENPMYHMYSARCYEKISDFSNAINALDLCLMVIKQKPEFEKWQQKVIEYKTELKGKK